MLYLPSALIVTQTEGVNFSRPVIGWQQLVTASNIAATSEDADYPAIRLANPNTNEAWLSGSTSTQYLTVTLDGLEDVDYLAIARHNFGSIGASLTVEGDTGSGYAAVSDQVAPADDKPLMFRFAAAAYTGIRLKIENVSAAPRAAVLFVGALLVMEKGVQPGHTPLPYGRERDIVTGRSESGEYLGRIVSGGKLRSTAMFKVLTPGFVRGDLAAFLAYSGPFFFAWSPQTYSAEVGYAWCVTDPVPVPSHHAGFADLTLEMEGLAL